MNNIEELKKVELHLHLDGAVPIDSISKISGQSKEYLEGEMRAPEKCQNLGDYLTRFDIPIKHMQTKENLINISKAVVDCLENQNVIYAELRFAPMFHTNEGLEYNEVVEAVIEGLKKNTKVKTNLILCMMRGFPKKNNMKTIEAAYKYLGKGVCAIDLAGDEGKYPLVDYVELFDIIKQKKIPYTIHAGETGDYKEVELAVKLGTKRIGHGVASAKSLKTLSILKNNDVILEVCPTSNVQTNIIDTYVNHPIKKLYDEQIKVCVNTDNATVSNITLNGEYKKLVNGLGFIIEDFKKMNIQAINYAFLSQEEKDELLKQM